MRDLIIRNLDDALLVELKRRAWHEGLPLEESLRRLLVTSVEVERDPDEQSAFVLRTHDGGRHGAAPYVALHA